MAAPTDPEPTCCVCEETMAKYRCPSCSRQTCSVSCVKSHKVRYECDGKRKRTAFVKLSEFTDSHLMSDYNFLEEALKDCEAAKKLKQASGYHSLKRLPAAMSSLQRQAKSRGADLIFLQPGMSRRKENSTYFDKKRRIIFWHVEWSFPDLGITLVDKKVQEHETLGERLKQKLESNSGVQKWGEKLEPYLNQTVSLFLKKEPSPANDVKYFQISPSDNLNRALCGLRLIEFPTFVVSLESSAAKYTIEERKSMATSEVVAEEDMDVLNQLGKTYREEEPSAE